MKIIGFLFLSAIILFGTSTLYAQEEKGSKVDVSVGSDLVSSYIFRGSHVAGASFQPSFEVGYAGLTLEAWGSSNFNNVVNEFDWVFGYGTEGFSIAVTDYFGPYTSGEMPRYFAKKSHILEGTVGFDFSEICKKFALTVNWNTNFLNDLNDKGDEQYSTYIELGYPVAVKETDIDFTLGFSPWEGLYSESFNVVNISIKGSKKIKITDSFSLPVFAQVVLNPSRENVYFVFGLSF